MGANILTRIIEHNRLSNELFYVTNLHFPDHYSVNTLSFMLLDLSCDCNIKAIYVKFIFF